MVRVGASHSQRTKYLRFCVEFINDLSQAHPKGIVLVGEKHPKNGLKVGNLNLTKTVPKTMALKGIPGEYLKDLSDCRLKNPRQEEFLDKLLLVQSNPKLTAVQKAKETVELLKPLQSTVMPKFIVALVENEPKKNVEDMKY